jgi:hypothetical protein
MKRTLRIALPVAAALSAACGSAMGPVDAIVDDGGPAAADTDAVAVEATDPAGDAEISPPDTALIEVAIEPTPGYLKRQAQHLAACAAAGEGDSIDAAVCRTAVGQPWSDAAKKKIAGLDLLGKDTSDFTVARLVRILYLDRAKPSLDPAVRGRIETLVQGMKYWIDEPGKDKACYWSENHEILYHANELLAGRLFPDVVFTNNGRTGKWHADHAAPMVTRWLMERARFGFSEWHSNVYFNEDMPPLVNLADWAPDEATRTRAAMVLDTIAFDFANNLYDGYFATAHGRTYEGHVIGGLDDSTQTASWLMTGLGEMGGATNFTGSALATSPGYWPAPVLESVAAAAEDRNEHRQRDGIDVADGPKWGIGYEDFDDIIFWAGMAAILAPDVIDGTADMLDALDLWDAFLFGDLPDTLKNLLKGMHEGGQLKDLATQLEPLSRGMALEAMSTYAWRTPRYQLAGAQDHRPGLWGTQTMMWQATLDRDAYVLTTYPTDASALGLGATFGGEWIGGWYPRATLHRNVGVIQYRYTDNPAVNDFLKTGSTHAYFPRTNFDEVRSTGHWTIGRKGDAYLALWSQAATAWATDNDYELVAEGRNNVWVVELGSREENGAFDAFATAIAGAAIEVGDTVKYASPSLGAIEVGWTGPMTVAGVAVDLGPYERWDNGFARQEFGTTTTVIEHDGLRYEMDFEAPARSLFRATYDLPGCSDDPAALSTCLVPSHDAEYYVDQAKRYFDTLDLTAPPDRVPAYSLLVARWEWPPWLKLTGYGREQMIEIDQAVAQATPATYPVMDCRAFAVQPFARCRVVFRYAEGDCPIYEEFTFNDAGETTFIEAWSDLPGLLPTSDPSDAWAERPGVHRLSTRVPGLGNAEGLIDPTAAWMQAAAAADPELADFVARTQDFLGLWLEELQAAGDDLFARGCGW